MRLRISDTCQSATLGVARLQFTAPNLASSPASWVGGGATNLFMATNCFKCNAHLPLRIRRKGLILDYCEKCQEEVNKKYTINPCLPKVDWDKEIFCKVCNKKVPMREKTEEAIRYGWGLCSKKCSKILRETYGNPIPNRMGKYQVKNKRKDSHSKKQILASSFNIHF